MFPAARLLLAWAATLTAAFAWLMPTAGLVVVGGTLLIGGAWAALASPRPDGRVRRAVLGGLGVLALGALCVLLSDRLEPVLGRWAALVPLALALLLVLTDVQAVTRVIRLATIEARKLVRGRLLRVGLLATAGLTLLAALTYDAVPGATGWTRAAHGLGVGQWISDVFLLVLGATALAGEATGGTLKMMLPHAYRRSDWILAKAVVLIIAAAAFAVVAAGSSLIPAALQDGLGNVETEPLFGESADHVEVFAPANRMWNHILVTTLAGAASGAAMAIVGLFLSTLFDGVVASLSTAFLMFAGIRLADVLLAIPREDLIHHLFAWPPVQLREVLGKLGRGLSERWDPALLPTALGLSAVTSVLLILVATRVFQVRDVHA